MVHIKVSRGVGPDVLLCGSLCIALPCQDGSHKVTVCWSCSHQDPILISRNIEGGNKERAISQ